MNTDRDRRRPEPPRIAKWLLAKIGDRAIRDSALGDFHEQFSLLAHTDDRRKARMWYWTQVVRSLPAFAHDATYWSFAMLKSYMTVAFRNFLKYKTYAFINIFGLAVGLASCLVILLFVRHELSYDRFHSNANHIYRVVRDTEQAGRLRYSATTPIPLATALKRDLPEVEETVRLLPQAYLIRHSDKAFSDRRVLFSDSTFFEVFDFHLLRGDPKTALTRPNTVVMTESQARLYFGSRDPFGETLVIETDAEFEVTGVVQDTPENSHFRFDFLVSFASLGIDETQSFRWRNQINYYTYVLLRPNQNAKLLGQRIQAIYRTYSAQGSERTIWKLQPLTRIHLHSDRENELAPNGSAATVTILIAIALFILLIACINFVNLGTARSTQRSKEVGLRKVLGADRLSLIKQFLGESILTAVIALVLALVLVLLFEPYLATFTKTEALASNDLWPFLVLFLTLAMVVGIGAGLYPALFLSAFQPIRSLSTSHQTGTLGLVLRRGLVVFQFSISIVLIVGTVVMYRQLEFVRNKRLGFQKEQVLVLSLPSELRQNYESLKDELTNRQGVVAASALYQVPGERAARNTFRPEGFSEGSYPSLKTLYVDHDVLQTLGIELIAGRGFSEAFATDATEAFILNETAARLLGWQDPIGKRISWWNRDGQVIGVVRDFHFASLHQKIEPLVMFIFPDLFKRMAVRVSPVDLPRTLAQIEDTWKTFVPTRPFEYSFLDQKFGQLYAEDREFGAVCGLFSLLAVLIACLGLFGLAAFSVEQRRKEIGVRKVLGASASGLIVLLSREFAVLVSAAFVVATPVAYLAMQRWLENFAYRVDFSVWPFLVSVNLALFIAMITVSSQAIKAALTNPVESLRVE